MGVQKTALYDLHKSLGAKFVPFAGYEMPIQYKDGIVKEHISTRTHAGFFDVSHMGQFFLEGDETLVEALEKIIPSDLKSLKVNHSKYSFLLNDDGGIIDDLIVTKTNKGFCIILNAACKENDIKHISKFLGKNHKHLLNNDLSLIALQGPKSVEILEKLIPGVSELKFMTGNNFIFDNEAENLTALEKSKCLITDTSGIAIEYLLLMKRPILYFEDLDKIHNIQFDKFKDLETMDSKVKSKFGYKFDINQIDNLKEKINFAISDFKDKDKSIVDFIEENFYNYNKTIDYFDKEILKNL